MLFRAITHTNARERRSYNKRGIKKTDEQRKDENFRRLKKTLTKRGDNLRKFEADVYVQLRRKGKISIYTSRKEDLRWPLRTEDIVRCLMIS